MQISQTQFESTHTLDKDGFITRLCEEVINDVSWVERAWPPQFIQQMVSYAYDRATIANGLMRDMDISIYVTVLFLTHAEFDQHPRIANVLHDSTLHPDEKWTILMGPDFEKLWDSLESESHNENLFPEGQDRIEDAYPTTHHMAGFQELYAKVRRENYYFLEDGESMGIA